MPSSQSLSQSIENNQLDEVITYLNKVPGVINQAITPDGLTPLMLSSKLGFEDIVILLLGRGADVFQENGGISALIYAFESENERVVKRLQSYLPISPTPFNVLKELEVVFQSEMGKVDLLGSKIDLMKSAIFSMTHNFLVERLHKKDLSPILAVDTYLTLSSFLSLKKMDNEQGIKVGLKDIFNARSQIIKGTLLDYNSPYQLSLNILLKKIVGVVWEDDLKHKKTSINQILFDKAVTFFNGEKKEWFPFDSDYDPYLEEENPETLLPEEQSYFVRDSHHRIHETHALLNIGIDNLKLGKSNPDDIWTGADRRDITSTSLEPEVISLLSQYSPSIKKLNCYINSRHQEMLAKGLRSRFEALRDGLIKGDKRHGGTHFYAGEDAVAAQVEFGIWWSQIKINNISLYNKIMAYSIYSPQERKKITMADIIRPIEDQRAEADRDNAVFCVETMGRRLENFLSNKQIQTQMALDSQFEIIDYTDGQLEDIRGLGLSDLSNVEKAQFQDLELPFDTWPSLLPWIELYQKSGVNLSYLDLERMNAVMQKTSHDTELFSELFFDPPLLLEKDEGNLKEIAIRKHFIPLVLYFADEITEDDFSSLSYQSQKHYLRYQHKKNEKLPNTFVQRTFISAIDTNDYDWIVYLLKEELIKSEASFDFYERRYPELEAGMMLSIPSPSGEPYEYSIIARKGSLLKLSLNGEGPEYDIELSLLNHEKLSTVKCYSPERDNFFPLIQEIYYDNLFNYSLVCENLTLFRYLLKSKMKSPDFKHLINPRTGLFINLQFVKDLLFCLVNEGGTPLTKEELALLFQAVSRGGHYELLKPLIQLGLSVETKIIKQTSFDLEQFHKGQNCHLYYPSFKKWINCIITQSDERYGVKRLLLTPVGYNDLSALLPEWVNISDERELRRLDFSGMQAPVNTTHYSQATNIFQFAFEEDRRELWPFLIETKLARDDSFLMDASNTKCKQYIDSLSKAGLTLSKNCTVWLMQKLMSASEKIDASLLAALANHNPSIAKTVLNKTVLRKALFQWSLENKVYTLIPVFMNWHESLGSLLADCFIAQNKAAYSFVLQGLKDNLQFYKLQINKQDLLSLFEIAMNFDLLYPFSELFRVFYEEGMLTISDLSASFEKIFYSLSGNETKATLLFFDKLLALESAGFSDVSQAGNQKMAERVKERLITLRRRETPIKEARLKLVSRILPQLCEFKKMEVEVLDALVLLINFESDFLDRKLFMDICKLGLKHGEILSVRPLIDKLEPEDQVSLVSIALNKALERHSFSYFNDCINEPEMFIQNFLKVYQALYQTKGYLFFRSAPYWRNRTPSLEDIFNRFFDSPDSLTAKALKIVINELEGFCPGGALPKRLHLFNTLYRTSIAQSWFAHSHLPREEERTFCRVGEYAKEHEATRTATIWQSLEWEAPSKS